MIKASANIADQYTNAENIQNEAQKIRIIKIIYQSATKVFKNAEILSFLVVLQKIENI